MADTRTGRAGGPDGTPDDRVRAAVGHWAPRFVANGVDYNDFLRVTAAIRSWDSWCEQWCLAGARHEQLGRAALADGRNRSAGTHLSQAAVYYHFAKFMFVHDLGQLRAAHLMALRCAGDALPHLDPPGERVEIPFEGTTLAAVLRRPGGQAGLRGQAGFRGQAGLRGGTAGPHPLVVLIPGLDSAKEEFRPTEEAFLRRGLATLSVDGPGQGEAEYDLAIRADWEVPGQAIVDAAAGLPGIDADRIGVWGVSLGGYYAARVASGVAQVRAWISLCGPYSLGEVWDQLPELSRQAFAVRAKAGSPEAARQRAAELTMTGRAASITAPGLVIAGKQDRIFPWADAGRLAAEIGGPTELMVLEQGNHGCANVPYEHRPYAADWMAGKLAGSERG